VRNVVASVCAAIILGTAAGQGAFVPISPQDFAAAVSQEAPAFVVAESGVGIEPPEQLMQLLFQCMQPFGQAVGDLLYIHGYSVVDARDYRLNGPMALQEAFIEAELNAQAAAAAMLQGVSTYARNARERSTRNSSSGNVSGDVAVGELTSTFSSSAFRTVSQEANSETSAYLRGGRAIGVRIISLGEEGFCVVMRYGIPLDQSGFDPSRTSSPGASTEPAGNSSDGAVGFPFPPRGVIGSF
jgi:hypothetical protein